MWPFAIVLLTNIILIMSENMIENFTQQRDALIKKEFDMMLGSGIQLSDSELKANQIIMDLKLEEVENGFIHPKNFSLSKHFFEYKDRVKETKLYQIIQKMPKGAILHAHDTGMLSPDYVLQVTYMDNLYVCFDGDSVQFKFSKSVPDCSCNNGNKWQLMKDARHSSGNVKKFDADLRKHFTIVIDNYREVYTDVNSVWQYFGQYFGTTESLLTYKPVWEQYFYDTLKALRDDNVMYLEIRSVLPKLYDLEDNLYDPVETAQSYLRVTENFKKQYPDFVGVKLIYAPTRLVTSDDVKEYIKTAREIKSLMPDFLAGFDLVGQEDLGMPLKEFLPEMIELSKDLELYLHAGETNWFGTSTDENLFDAVALGAKRIGHAYALVKHPLLMEEVKRRGIALEINLVSNNVLKLVEDIRNHPLAAFLALDMPVILSSDDPGIWEADPLSHDFYVAFVGVASLHGDLRLLKQLALNSLIYNSYPDKDVLLNDFENRWKEFIDSVIRNQL